MILRNAYRADPSPRREWRPAVEPAAVARRLAPLLAEIEAFLARTRMARTTFGQRALNDPKLVDNLCEGRAVRSTTVATAAPIATEIGRAHV